MSRQFIAMSLPVREDWTIQRDSFQRLLGSSTRIHQRFFLCAPRVFRGEIKFRQPGWALRYINIPSDQESNRPKRNSSLQSSHANL
jgi:hypothetical protein